MSSKLAFAIALALLSLAGLSGCASGPLGPYESCLREPTAYREGRSRLAYTSSDGVRWMDWGGGGIPPREPVLRVAMSIKDCLYSVQAEEANGAPGAAPRWVVGGFTYLDEMSFHQDRSGRRVGFVAFGPKAAYAVIDGVKSPPYKDVLWRPSFSLGGGHSGYLARTQDGAVAVVDGQVVGRAPDYHRGLFEVLDDGRFAAAPKRADGMYEVVLGSVRSPPVTDLCDRFPVIRPSGRFAFVGKRGGQYVTFVDGREVPAPGLPAGCEIIFSEDDARWGWIAIHTGPGGLKSEETGAVVDGTFFPLPERGTDVHFRAGLAVVRTQRADPSGNTIHGNRKWENVHWLVDLPTPAVPPTEDGYFPADGGFTVEWSRVRIGDSLGPRFDEIDWRSLRVDESGSVRYTGVRGGSRLQVVDNVLAARRAVVAEPLPQTDGPTDGPPDAPPRR